MQRRVRVLDEVTINKIAAGEVVERPSSVVKELVENSIDANARRISISVEESGARSISVVDDGEGMNRDDALLALERHATSKIEGADDIFGVETLGFRGEALPSIAAVSRLTMVTRTAESPGGVKVSVEGGKKPVVADHPSAPGTSVTVRDLFFNTPARRKYLKSPGTEMRRIVEIVTGEALGHPEIAFSLESGGRRVLFTSGSGDLLQALGEVIGANLAKSLVEFAGGVAGISVHGYISKPSFARSNRRDLILIVNGRPIFSGLLIAAITRAYGTAMPKGRYPVGAVVIAVDPQRVDVNVHPAKTEVRFADEQPLFSVVTKTIASAVGLHEIGQTKASAALHSHRIDVSAGSGTGRPRPGRAAEGLFAAEGPSVVHSAPVPSGAHGTTVPATPRGHDAGPETLLDAPVQYTLVGQFWDSCIAVSTDQSFFLIDQHAAMERLLFDDLMRQFQSSSLASQEALLPDTVILSTTEAQAVEEHKTTLERLGFSLEPFGMGAYLIRAVPSILDSDDGEEAFREVLSAVSEDSAATDANDLSGDLASGLCARLACKAAVKANHRLSPDEMVRLVDDLFSRATSLYCPHGRPAVISYSREDIERRFGRR